MSSIWGSIEDEVSAVKDGINTATANVLKAFDEIDKNKEYSAIISLTTERAYKRATQVDELIKSGKDAGRLAGIPFIVKDNFLAFGAETTAASNMLKGFASPYQATAIELLEAEGAICVAKANLDAFAHGGSRSCAGQPDKTFSIFANLRMLAPVRFM